MFNWSTSTIPNEDLEINRASQRTREWLENGVILVAGMGCEIFHRTLAFKASFILPIFAVCAIYLAWEGRAGRKAEDFGLRTDNLKEASWAAFWVFLPFIMGLIFYGLYKGTSLPPHFYETLAFYPIWGLIQQFIFQGIFCGNFLRLGLGKWAIPISALFYASVHGPSHFMLFATLIGGICFATLYSKWTNIIPLGIGQGILGALLYFLVLGRDPILRLIPHLH